MENSRLERMFTLMLCGVLVKSYANPLFYNGRLINKLPKHPWCHFYLWFSNYLSCTESAMYLLLKRTWSEAKNRGNHPIQGGGWSYIQWCTVVWCMGISTSTWWAYRTHVPCITKLPDCACHLSQNTCSTTHCHSWQLSSKNPNKLQPGPDTRITSVTLRFIVFTAMLSAQMWRLMELQCNRKWMICAPAAAGLHASLHVLVCASLTPHPPSWVHHPTER
jgi:hypothetical protein